jgi:hypothetical protein
LVDKKKEKTNMNRFVIGTLLAAVMLVACGGGGGEDAKSPSGGGGSGETIDGRPIDKAAIANIKKGSDTKSTIEKTFGKPYKAAALDGAPAECADSYQYRHSAKNGKMLHVEVLIVAFDPNGVVCHHDFGGQDAQIP